MLRKEEGECAVSKARKSKCSKELHKAYPAFCLTARNNSQQILQLPYPSEEHFQHVHFTLFLKVSTETEPPFVCRSNLLINEPKLTFLSFPLHLSQGTQTKERTGLAESVMLGK